MLIEATYSSGENLKARNPWKPRGQSIFAKRSARRLREKGLERLTALIRPRESEKLREADAEQVIERASQARVHSIMKASLLIPPLGADHDEQQ